MGIEKKIEVDEYGRKRYIDEFDKVIKIGDKFLQVRLIKIETWKTRTNYKPQLTNAMPRAKFVRLNDANFYYLVSKEDIIDLKRLNGIGK